MTPRKASRGPDMFDQAAEERLQREAPLAARMRPQFKEVVPAFREKRDPDFHISRRP